MTERLRAARRKVGARGSRARMSKDSSDIKEALVQTLFKNR